MILVWKRIDRRLLVREGVVDLGVTNWADSGGRINSQIQLPGISNSMPTAPMGKSIE